MEIVVYTKPGCKLCASFKDKLRNNLKIPFDERDLERSLRVSDTWREDGTHRLAAVHAHVDGAVPLILIDKYAYKYAEALAEIKRRLNAGEEATMPEPERDKSLDEIGPQLTEAEFVAAVWKLCENHVDIVMVTSPVGRTYDCAEKPPARREVRGRVEVWIDYRDPTVKPMLQEQFRAEGQGFREALRNLRGRIEVAKRRGIMQLGR